MPNPEEKPTVTSRHKRCGRIWLRVIGGILALLILVHRPLLLGIGRAVAIHFAAKENLKLDLTLEGTIFTSLIVRNLHITPTAPSALENVSVDYLRVDYSLWDLARRGLAETIKNVELRSATVILNPANAPPVVKPVKPATKPTLPNLFPARLVLSDVNFISRAKPADLVVNSFNLKLYADQPGELRIARLQVPGLHEWMRVTGSTSYQQKNLVLSNVVLDDDTRLTLLNLDASHSSAHELQIVLEAIIASGSIKAAVNLGETPTSLSSDVRFSATDLSLGALSTYFGAGDSFSGAVQNVEITWQGILDRPKSWTGTLSGSVANLKHDKLLVDSITWSASAAGGLAHLAAADIIQSENKLHIQGDTELPSRLSELGHAPANLQLTATVPELAQITASMDPPVKGHAELGGNVSIHDNQVTADLRLQATDLASGKASVATITASIKAAKQLPSPGLNRPFFDQLSTDLQLSAANLRFDQYVLDNVTASMTSSEDALVLNSLGLHRKSDNVTITGTYKLPADFGKAAQQPGTLRVDIAARELGDFWLGATPDRVTGSLTGDGSFRFVDASADGQLSLYGSAIKVQNLTVNQLSSQIAILRNTVYLNDLTASLNAQDYVAANGTFIPSRPFHYAGKVAANLADLSTLKPLLAHADNKPELAGKLVLNWQGSGDAATFQNYGALKLQLNKGRYANLQGLEATIDANYSPEALDVPIIYFGNPQMDFQAILQAKGSTLEISKIQLDQGKANYATGYASIPFVWKNLGTDAPLFPTDGKVSATVQSQNLDIKKIFDQLGTKAPGTGVISLKLEAQGTFAKLAASLDVDARDLRSAQLPTLDPASFTLAARVENDRLNVSGKLQQSKIQPVQLDATLPLDVSKLIETKKLDENTPVNAKVKLPRSSVNFLRQFVPAIRDLDGDMALDVAVNGTMAKPELSGSGDISINQARFTNATLPALTAFKSRLVFDHNTLRFERFGGDLAGGPFNLAGKVTLQTLTAPVFDLRLTAQSVLVARNDALTARADADVTVTGPLKAAKVAGTVALTNSQFLKNLDLIPIGLPGRPAPQPPSSQPDFSFPQPPLRDWTFDVAIKTKDNFLIRGNLANGGAVVDMRLIGTGLHPGLTGLVRLENVEATLPFSRLQISHGFLYFDPSDSLNPKLDLQGTSVIRDYIIHVYVYGSTTAPEVVFTSEPPLPQEEIISLLATGSTRQELAGSGDALAGRATMLVLQQLYRKYFKKGAPTKSNPVFDRLQVDIGNVDPRTGQQSAAARLKLNEHFVLVGDLAVGGDFRGILKYLIRFR